MKSQTLCQENSSTIMFRLKQFFSRHECTQSYTDWGKYPRELNKMGIKPYLGTKHIEKSMICYAIKGSTRVRFEKGYGIVINIGTASADSINLGYKVKITPNKITISGYDALMKRNFISYYFPSSDIDKAKKQIYFNEQMDEQYWKDYESELYHEK